MDRFNPPSRGLIARLVGKGKSEREPNHEMIKRLEQLWRRSGIETPTEIDSQAEAQASFEASIRSLVEEVAARIIPEMLAPAPQPVIDKDYQGPLPQPPEVTRRAEDFREVDVIKEPSLSEMADVFTKDRLTGNLLVWNSNRRQYILQPLKIRDLDLVSLGQLNDGDILKWNNDLSRWEAFNGWSGTFTTLDGETVTVANGLITDVT